MSDEPAVNTEVLKGASPVHVPITEDVRHAVSEALGARDLAIGTKAIVMAILRGTGETGTAAMTTLSQTARAVVRHTSEMHGDVGESTKGLVLGAIASAKTTGVERPQAATAAGRAAIAEAELIGAAAVARVRGALKQEIGGILVAI